MNVLLVGAGRWGEKHLRVLGELGATVWLAEASAPRRQWAVTQGLDAARVVADYREALHRVDAVDIVTPADSHLPITLACLDAGRHCFVEKPLAMTVAEGRQLAAAAQRAGRVLQVGHILRFHPVTDVLRESLRIDRIGAVRFARARFAGFKRPRTDVGVTQTDAIHFFDLFAHLLGPATSVWSVQRDFLGRGLDDFSLTLVNHGTTPAWVEADYFVPGTYRECVIVGERGSLVADYATFCVAHHTGEHHRRGESWEAIEKGKNLLSVGTAEPLRVELEAFLAACRGARPCPVPASDGVASLEVVEAAARAATLGRTVTIEEIRAT